MTTPNADHQGETLDDPSEKPQLFDPQKCDLSLPVGRSQHRNVFWRVTAFDVDVDMTDLVDETLPPARQIQPGVAAARLGLPIGVITPPWREILPVRAVRSTAGIDISVGADGVFLPSKKMADLRDPEMEVVPVGDLDALDEGTFEYGEGTLKIHPGAAQRLLRDGVAYARRTNEDGSDSGLVLVSLLVTVADVPPAAIIDPDVPIPLNDQTDPHFLSNEERQLLASGERVVVRHGATAVLFMPPTVQGMAQVRTRQEMRAAYATTRFANTNRGVSGQNWVTVQRSLELTEVPPWWQSVMDQLLRGGDVNAATPMPLYPMGWQEPFRAVPRYEIGLATPIVQEWALLGYERGALVGSISLEPGTEALLEVHTWDRQKLERSEETATTSQESFEVSGLTRTTGRVAAAAATALGTTMNAQGTVTLPVQAVDIGASAGGSTETQIDSSVESGLERVAEATTKSAQNFQLTHQIKVTHTTERGTENRATRKLRNPNPGRIIEFFHFEVSERHRVATRVDSPPRLVALIENPTLGAFEIALLSAHEHVLMSALMAPSYLPGFAAAKILQAQGWFENSPRHEEETTTAPGTGGATAPAGTASHAGGVPNTGVFQTARQIQATLKEFININLELEANILARNLNPFTPENAKPARSIVKKSEARFGRWSFWTRFSLAYPGIEDKARTFTRLKFDEDEEDEEKPASEEEVLAALQQLVDGLDDDWLVAVKTYAVAGIMHALATLLSGPLMLILQPLILGLVLVSDDMGLPVAITRARRELPGERAVQQGQDLITPKPDPKAEGAGPSPAPPQGPPQIFPDVDLALANADFMKLRHHLEAHRIYYENAIWTAEDPHDRLARLEAIGIAPYVENILLGFAGNRAMYPLRLDALPPETREAVQELCGSTLDNPDYSTKFPTNEQEIVLPTPAVHTQGYVGQCDLLEPYMLERRSVDMRRRYASALRDEAIAEQELQEANRLRVRLKQDPPLLDPPFGASSERDSDLTAPDLDADDE